MNNAAKIEPSKPESTVPKYFKRMMTRSQLRMVPKKKKKCGPPNDLLTLFN